MKSLFDIQFNKFMKSLISEQNDIISQYTPSGRKLWRGTTNEQLMFHFYDEKGDTMFILPWRSSKTWIPVAPERLTDEFEHSSEFNHYDDMAKSYVKSRISSSLIGFTSDAYDAPTRDKVRESNPFSVGRRLDRSFLKYFAWDLVKSSTGESYGWGLRNNPEGEYHLGMKMPQSIFTASERNLKIDDEKPTEAGYSFKFYDENGVNTYIIPFEPKGNYAFTDVRWKKINQLTSKQLKDRSTPEAKAVFKYLNDAILNYIDQLITISDNIPASDEEKTYPINGLDNDFQFKTWELLRDGESFAYGDRTTNYVKFGKKK